MGGDAGPQSRPGAEIESTDGGVRLWGPAGSLWSTGPWKMGSGLGEEGQGLQGEQPAWGRCPLLAQGCLPCDTGLLALRVSPLLALRVSPAGLTLEARDEGLEEKTRGHGPWLQGGGLEGEGLQVTG